MGMFIYFQRIKQGALNREQNATNKYNGTLVRNKKLQTTLGIMR